MNLKCPTYKTPQQHIKQLEQDSALYARGYTVRKSGQKNANLECQTKR